MIAHLAKNLHLLEPDLRLFGNGVEFRLFETYNGASPRIDILAIDKESALVVIECKVEHAHPSAVGQLAGYVQWLKENAAIFRKPVRAFLVCKTVSPMVWLAVRQVPGFVLSVFEYVDKWTLKRLDPPKCDPKDPP
jgi:RecB family endonuclease NucS